VSCKGPPFPWRYNVHGRERGFLVRDAAVNSGLQRLVESEIWIRIQSWAISGELAGLRLIPVSLNALAKPTTES
jgi:hypothetical protein